MNQRIIYRIVTTWFGIAFSLIFLQAQYKQEKSTIKLELTYNQKNDEAPVLKVSTKTKVNKKFKPIDGVEVNLFMGSESSKGFLGRVVTDRQGKNFLTLSPKAKTTLDSLSVFKFIGSVTSNDRFEETSTEIEITKARIELVLNEKDSARTMNARVFAKKDTGWVQVPEVELRFVVKRVFNDLPIVENASTTDASGNTSSDFKLTIPGDVDGNIFVAAKIEENELYGNIQSVKMIKWGTRVVKDTSFKDRTLFSTRDKTPLWLLIFPNLIIITVWCIIIYLVTLIVKIRKIGMGQSNI
jgi:hypothetical protein